MVSGSSLLDSHVVADRRLAIFHAADAGRGRKGLIFRQEQGKTHG